MNPKPGGYAIAKDNYFRIVYAILTELYAAARAGEKVQLAHISPERFHIDESYWLDIMCNQVDSGRIKGFKYMSTKTGRAVISLDDIGITECSIEFLMENSMMKKVVEALKIAKDILPGISILTPSIKSVYKFIYIPPAYAGGIRL